MNIPPVAAAFAADLIVFIHLLYVLFAVGGELLIVIGAIARRRWVRNRLFRFLHLGAVLLVAAESLLDITCPLTEWEYRLRIIAGQRAEGDITFIGRLIRSIIFYDFPPLFFTVLYVGFGLLVLSTFILIPPGHKKYR
jgi:hypothetical protein